MSFGERAGRRFSEVQRQLVSIGDAGETKCFSDHDSEVGTQAGKVLGGLAAGLS